MHKVSKVKTFVNMNEIKYAVWLSLLPNPIPTD